MHQCLSSNLVSLSLVALMSGDVRRHLLLSSSRPNSFNVHSLLVQETEIHPGYLRSRDWIERERKEGQLAALHLLLERTRTDG